MKKQLKRVFDTVIYYPLFTVTLTSMSVIARRKWHRSLKLYAHFNAKLVLMVRRGKSKETIEEIGEEWKSMFPNDMQRLIRKEEDTVYYETHTWCALRGSGDVEACYRMMEFDRAMHDKLGAEFVVIASQAEAGRKTCVVAMRKPLNPYDETKFDKQKTAKKLVHAHERVAQGKGAAMIPVKNIE